MEQNITIGIIPLVFGTGLISGVIVAVVNNIFTYKNAKNTHIEKWMNQLRNEVTSYLTIAEKVRLIMTFNKKSDADMFLEPVFAEFIGQSYKVELLLTDKKTFGKYDSDVFDQEQLTKHIVNIREARISGAKFDKESEKEVVNLTKKILDHRWNKIINSFRFF